MSKKNLNLPRDVEESVAPAISPLDRVALTYLTAVNGAPGAGQFRSSITNRAPILDPSANLEVLGPVNRIITQQLYAIPNEFGPNGEPVWGAVNDQWGIFRGVGGWTSANDAQGSRVYCTANTTDYAEFTFWGTGLNLVSQTGGATSDFRATVDGGSEGSNLYPSGSAVLSSRNYAPNEIIPIVSGLTAGLHTVKIRNVGVTTPMRMTGFEILNESSTLRVNPGTYLANAKAYLKQSASTLPFKPASYVGTTGAKVVVYENADGTVGQEFTNVGSPLYLTNASHANEEIIRKFYPREFGAGRSDDFSTMPLSGSNARAFTLDDNLHTLVCFDCAFNTSIGAECVQYQSASAFVTFTFEGSGLDVILTSGTGTLIGVYVDGVSQGNLSPTLSGSNSRVYTVASGMKFGTHVVKLLWGTSAALNLVSMITYGPKTPAIPSGAKALAEYFVAADYVANTVAGTETIGVGLIRSGSAREFIYVGGGWTVNSMGQPYVGGFQVYSATNGAYTEKTFSGDVFEFRGLGYSNASTNISVTVDGLPLTIANFPSLVISTYGGWVFSAGVLNQYTAGFTWGAGFCVKGLGAGKHIVRFTNNTTSILYVDCLDTTPPVYAPKYIGPFALQATSMIGNTSLCDKREMGVVSKAIRQSVGVTSDPTSNSSGFVPVVDLPVSILTSGNPVEISFTANLTLSTAGGVNFAMFVDGLQVGVEQRIGIANSGYNYVVTTDHPLQLSAGFHTVALYWKTDSGGTMTAKVTYRRLKVRELP